MRKNELNGIFHRRPIQDQLAEATSQRLEKIKTWLVTCVEDEFKDQSVTSLMT